MRLKTFTGEEIRAYRKERRLTQADFWVPLGITQSTGSRFGSGRELPGPIQILLNLALGKGENATAIVESLRAAIGVPKKTPPKPPKASGRTA